MDISSLNDGHTQKTCPRMRAGLLMCVLRQDFPRGEPKVKRLEEIYGVLVLGWVSSAKTAHETSTMCAVE